MKKHLDFILMIGFFICLWTIVYTSLPIIIKVLCGFGIFISMAFRIYFNWMKK